MAKWPNENGNNQSNSPFTLDNHGGEPIEMPSVTKLLNRKKLGLSPISENSTQTVTRPRVPTPPPAAKPQAPAQGSLQGTGQSAGPGQVEIQKVRPRQRQSSQRSKLAKWDKEKLSQARDTFQRAVFYLLQKGAQQVLLLTPQDPVTDPKAQVSFQALCAFASEEKDQLWGGLSLTPELIPDIWDKLFTKGIFEIVPSVSLKAKNESEAFLIRAFGLKPTEFFILIRCGAPNACTGLLGIVSTHSLVKEIAAAFSASKSVDRAA
jgi:hypothetical protein